MKNIHWCAVPLQRGHYCLLLETTSVGSKGTTELSNCVRSQGTALSILGFNSIWNVWCYFFKAFYPDCLGSCHLVARGYSWFCCAEFSMYFNNGSYNLWVHANSNMPTKFICFISTYSKLSKSAKLFVKTSHDSLRFTAEYK